MIVLHQNSRRTLSPSISIPKPRLQIVSPGKTIFRKLSKATDGTYNPPEFTKKWAKHPGFGFEKKNGRKKSTNPVIHLPCWDTYCWWKKSHSQPPGMYRTLQTGLLRWVMLDLGTARTVTEVRLYAPSAGFQVQVSTLPWPTQGNSTLCPVCKQLDAEKLTKLGGETSNMVLFSFWGEMIQFDEHIF